ncbi:MAG: hypothetical protein LBC18_14290 [Opitutaceae bacterium]|jgi:hypothetical protein|nr:hypothetical protein [Opitutaceae bacterium]
MSDSEKQVSRLRREVRRAALVIAVATVAALAAIAAATAVACRIITP